MASKMPYLQFYPADWIADTRILSLPARAVWLELILAMHQRWRVGTLTGSTERLAGLVGCSVPELDAALAELSETDTAEVLRDCNGVVTVTCRRMKNENSEREKIKIRVRDFRMKRECNANVTPDSTEYRKVHTQSADADAHTREEDPIPHSVEDVLELAQTVFCGLPCTREQADAYFTDRVCRDWTPALQQSRLKTQTQIAADLKRWLMRDQKEKVKRKERRDGVHIDNDPNAYNPDHDGSDI